MSEELKELYSELHDLEERIEQIKCEIELLEGGS